MATIFPEWLDESVTTSRAERYLFKLFKENLGDSFTVFHTVRFHARDARGGINDREIDFLIAHPNYGLLVLEVKGGQIQIDGKTKKWFSRDLNNELHDIKNPVTQAHQASYDLQALLASLETTREFSYPIWHGVALPDVIVDEMLYLDAPHEIVLDKAEVTKEHIQSSVERLFKYYQRSNQISPGVKGIKALFRVLARSWFLRSTMAVDFEHEEVQVKQMTEEQFRLLDFIETAPRALISGCAGSGKTMLAIEKARRLVDSQGMRVLFTCYNRNLAEYLAKTYDSSDKLDLYHFHSVCTRMSQKAGIPFEPYSEDAGYSVEHYWSEVVPQRLLDAIDKLPDRYDAIVVDEGQDFAATYWEPLQLLLKDPGNGIFYIFYDDSQRIYSKDELPFKTPEFSLTRNLRNVRPIGELVKQYYRGAGQIIAAGPDAHHKPQYISLGKYPSEVDALADVVSDLLSEKVPMNDIIVLTPLSSKSQWQKGMQVGEFTVTRSTKGRGKQLAVETIQSFKGLERPVVILSELDKTAEEDRNALTYVALSRARNHLIVLGNLPEPIK